MLQGSQENALLAGRRLRSPWRKRGLCPPHGAPRAAFPGVCGRLPPQRCDANKRRPCLRCPSFTPGERNWTVRLLPGSIFTPAIEFKEKGKKGKAVHFAEIDGPASDRNKNLDNFLMALLYYLSYFLEKISLERKPKSYMVALVEKKEMKLVLSKLDIAQKYLAQKYCILVLGLAMPDKHHMCCGKEKISDTQKDWKFFESFYTFCAYIAWIVFRRQHLTDIEEEIGRLFRSNMFNIPRRKREDEESGGEKKRMTFVQFRRMMAKRPAIKKAINMRSPVLSTLLPSPREKAQNIFEKKFHHGSIKLQAKIQKHLESLDTVAMPVVGILGEPRCLFNPHTLQPLELEETAKTPGRHFSVVERSNTRVRGTLDFALRTLSSQVTL
ncbi:protein phosphatase 1 regulatory subunit 36 isoform X7 [Elephas maximus indicus]|uniref:protein phosphatase 1 regulatory subunit 36 isoform X7 n=1 Tax=Elephas maximus indicus TaxID=99487 RepID=UPI0021161A2A|nr:protein phosphatase 1 regulatory subunit 36 isoform X7 [Elephas maximus indicus]